MNIQTAREALAQDYEARAQIFAERGDAFLAHTNQETAAEIRDGAQDDRLALAA